MAGNQGQIALVIQNPHLRFTDLHLRLQCALDDRKGLLQRLPLPADLGDHVITIGAAHRGQLPPFH